MKKVSASILILIGGYIIMSSSDNVTPIKHKQRPVVSVPSPAKPVSLTPKKRSLASLKTIIPKPQIIKNEYFNVYSKELEIEISKIKDSIISIEGVPTKVSHVLVKAKKMKGLSSSYEALVNPKTKQVYRTWNQTKFETNNDFKIKAAGLEYYSN